MTFTQKKLIGISTVMLGLLVGGFVLVRTTLYVPNGDITPDYVSTDTFAPTASSTAVAGTSTSAIVAPPKAETPIDTRPQKLLIPVINVDARVQHVGVKESGMMANPTNFVDVAWYKLGTIPGEVGSAAIAGHVDNAIALSGVFKRVNELKPGDDVYVVRKDGRRLHFKVDRLAYYPYKEAPAQEIFTSSDGKAHLNIITCAGEWLKDEKSYTLRLIAYTTLVE